MICFTYGGSPTQLIYIANVATSVATPVAGLFITLMIWRADVNKGYKAPRLLQISMTVCYIFALIMTWSALQKQIPNLIHSFIG
jgi:Mn2+/Fe2+ NRAMP family transporter